VGSIFLQVSLLLICENGEIFDLVKNCNRAAEVAQVVEWLPSKCKALSSTTSTAKKIKLLEPCMVGHSCNNPSILEAKAEGS
jgi:hypothetical protein